MPVAAADIGDLIRTALNELGRMRFESIAESLYDYVVMREWLKRERLTISDGTAIQWTVVLDPDNAAKHVGLFDADNVNISDGTVIASIPWRHVTTHWGYEHRETLMNRGASRIVNHIKIRRFRAMLSLVELLEKRAWSKPADSSDKLEPFGVPYWVVFDSNTTEGFAKVNPTGFPGGRAGIDSTAPRNARWANWTAKYTNVSKDDLIQKWRRAFRRTNFRSPIDIEDFRKGRGRRYQCFTNEPTINALELVGESQNENLGRDLASMDEQLTFRRNPVFEVPQLNDNAEVTDPIYCLDMSKFYPVVLKGDYLRETGPIRAPNQHNVWRVHVDLTYNYLCRNLRCQAVLAKA